MGLNEVLARSAHASTPLVNKIVVVSVAVVSAALQLNVVGELGADFTDWPRVMTLKADGGKVWFFFASTAETVDETSTAASSATRCFSIDDGERQDWEWDHVAGADVFIVTKAAAACRLRIALTSPLGGAG